MPGLDVVGVYTKFFTPSFFVKKNDFQATYLIKNCPNLNYSGSRIRLKNGKKVQYMVDKSSRGNFQISE